MPLPNGLPLPRGTLYERLTSRALDLEDGPVFDDYTLESVLESRAALIALNIKRNPLAAAAYHGHERTLADIVAKTAADVRFHCYGCGPAVSKIREAMATRELLIPLLPDTALIFPRERSLVAYWRAVQVGHQFGPGGQYFFRAIELNQLIKDRRLAERIEELLSLPPEGSPPGTGKAPSAFLTL